MIVFHPSRASRWAEFEQERGHLFVMLTGPRWTEGYIIERDQFDAILAVLAAPAVDRFTPSP